MLGVLGKNKVQNFSTPTGKAPAGVLFSTLDGTIEAYVLQQRVAECFGMTFRRGPANLSDNPDDYFIADYSAPVWIQDHKNIYPLVGISNGELILGDPETVDHMKVGNIAFWKYDQFPYYLSARITEVSDQDSKMVKVAGYGNHCFRVAFCLPEADGIFLSNTLSDITLELEKQTNVLRHRANKAVADAIALRETAFNEWFDKSSTGHQS